VEPFFFAVVPVLLLVIIAETLAAARWVPSYFRTGIVVYRRDLRASQEILIDTVELDRQFGQSIGPAILFRELAVGECGFREKLLDRRLFRLNYSPVMRGHISVRGTTGTLVGRLNWMIVALALMALAFFVWYSSEGGALGVIEAFTLGCGVVIVGGIYGVQRHRFSSVADVLEQGSSPTGR
jgi:hypothetical protein